MGNPTVGEEEMKVTRFLIIGSAWNLDMGLRIKAVAWEGRKV